MSSGFPWFARDQPSLTSRIPQRLIPTSQGAGETLRGSLNSAVDKRFGNAPPETLATHQNQINAGKQEFQTGVFNEQTKYQEGGAPKLKGILRKTGGDVGGYNAGESSGTSGAWMNGAGMSGMGISKGNGMGNEAASGGNEDGLGNGKLRVINE